MTQFAEALERYRQLLKDADRLDEIADPNKYGGPSFWRDMRLCTGAAISGEYGEGREPGKAWSMTTAQLDAISSVATDHLGAIWKDAAKQLRERASRMRVTLENERAELDETIEQLKQPVQP